MSIIEALANKIADEISQQLSLDQERRAVIAYGLIGVLQITTLLFLITVLGIATSTLVESLIIFFGVGFMRKSTGGAHSKTMWGCNTVSVLSIASLALISRYLLGVNIDINWNLGITVAVFLVGLAVFYQRVPIDSPNKPIVSADKIKRLRKESFSKLVFLLALTVIIVFTADSHHRFYSIASSIRMAMLWQTITLTEMGTSLLSKVDSAINRVLY